MSNALAALLAKKKMEKVGEVSPIARSDEPSTPIVEQVSPHQSSQPADSTPQSPVSDEVKAEESSTEVAQNAGHPPSPPARRLLLATPKPPAKQPNVMDAVAVARVIKPELTVESIANSDGTLEDPHAGERFKMTLDLLDSKLQEIGGTLDQFNIDTVRSMISRIMIDLKEHPDYDGLYLGDRDVHNIMSFMYRVKEMAQESNAKKAIKAEVKTKKKSQSVNFGAALDNLAIGDLTL